MKKSTKKKLRKQNIEVDGTEGTRLETIPGSQVHEDKRKKDDKKQLRKLLINHE